MREMGLQPYKIKLLQELQPCDYAQRLAFGKWIKDNITELSNIKSSDEAYFSLDGLVNCHNNVIWAFENPRAIQTRSLHQKKIMLLDWFFQSSKT